MAYYSIYFNANGGDFSISHVSALTDATISLPVEIPTHPDPNAQFLGWGLSYNQYYGLFEPGQEFDYNHVASWGTDTLYAIWDIASEGTYNTVKFDPNGGRYDHPEMTEAGPVTIPGPEPEKDYYQFVRWESDIGDYFACGDYVDYSTTLVAQYEAINYEINYELNGGDYNFGGDEFSYSIEHIPDLSLIQPSKGGYTFEGWYNFSGEPVITLHPSMGHITLYAKWSEDTIDETLIEVSFYPGGDNVEGLPEAFTETGIYVAIPDIIPTRPGYYFSDWALGDPYGYSVMPGETLDCDVYGYTLELYARWTPIYYDINFELNGGDWSPEDAGNVDTTYCPVESIFPSIYTPKKAGYTFEGWYLNSDFTGDKIIDLYNQMGNLILYAKWVNKVSTQVWIRTKDKWSKGLLYVKTTDLWKQGMPKINVDETWKPNIKS